MAGTDYEVTGRENIPATGGMIVAAKHQSFWETFVLVTIFRDPVFILGQGFGVFVYARNLYFELRDRRTTAQAA